MSVRSFVFCDICNPLGFRCPEQRRETHRGDRDGRRVSDARAWVEGDSQQAIQQGWLLTPRGQHICPQCRQRHQSPPQPADEPAAASRDFIFCDCCNPQGIRYIELRRGASGTRPRGSGRRLTDGRAWHEGDAQSARRQGWFIGPTAHYCRQCVARHPEFVSSVARARICLV